MIEVDNTNTATLPLVSGSNEYLTFTLGKEEYEIEILKVQEIRGIIVLIVNMRIKFYFDEATYDDITVVIILNIAGRVVGMVVGNVANVVQLARDEIRSMPNFSSSAFDTQYFIGLGTLDNLMLILVDVEKLMAGSDMALIEQTAN